MRIALSVLLLLAGHACRADEIRIATWNLEWFFDNDKSDDRSDLAKEMSAPSAQEYKSRVEQIAASIQQLNPDVMALQEIENKKVVKDLADRLHAAYHREYQVAFVQGTDVTTEQDVAFLVRGGIRLEASRFKYRFHDGNHKDLSKHLHLKATIQGATFHIITVHLNTGPDDRLRQARTLRLWIDPLIRENLVVLGDMNMGLRFNETTPQSGIGIIRGFGTTSTDDDLFDCHQTLGAEARKTHASGREYDRVLVSPSLHDGRGLDFRSIATRRELAIKGAPDRENRVAYDLPPDKQDNSDHFPLLAIFSTTAAVDKK